MANEIVLGQSLDALSTNKIINLPNGTDPGDSVNFSQLSALIGGVTYIGSYDADTNTPDLVTPAMGTVLQGYMYVVNVSGTAFFSETLEVGDILISNIDNPAALSDWTVAQSNNTVPVYDRVYFVSSEVGDDTNNGLSEFAQFATLEAAVTAANAALPAASNSDPIIIKITDGAVYEFGSGAKTLNGFIHVIGESATLTGNGTIRTELSCSSNVINVRQIDGTDLTIQQTSGTGFGALIVYAKAIFNANGLFRLMTADGANGDKLHVETVVLAGPGADILLADTGSFYISAQSFGNSVSIASDVYGIKATGGEGKIIINDIDGTNSDAGGDYVAIRAENGAKIFAVTNCNSADVAYSADGVGSEIHATGLIEFGFAETSSGIVYLNTQKDGAYVPNLPATGGLALTDLIKITKAGVSEKATLTELQTIVTDGFVDIASAQTITGEKTFEKLKITDQIVDTTGTLTFRTDAVGVFQLGAYSNGANVVKQVWQTGTGENFWIQVDTGGNISMFTQQSGSLTLNGTGQDLDTRIRGDAGNVLWVDAVLNAVAIGNTASIPNSSAVLDVQSTTKGFLPPRMTAAQATAITAVDGLILYATDTDATFTSVGHWVYENGAWVKMTTSGPIYPQTITRTTGTHAATDRQFILCDTSGGNITLNLPAAASSTNAQISIKKTDAANTVTIDGNGTETIDGAATAVLSSQWEMISIICDGTSWFIGN